MSMTEMTCDEFMVLIADAKIYHYSAKMNGGLQVTVAKVNGEEIGRREIEKGSIKYFRVVNKKKINFTDIKKMVSEQAEDEGLWCDAENVVEAYLQQELRKLHAAIEELE